MRAGLLLIVLALAACPPKPPPVPPPDSRVDMARPDMTTPYRACVGAQFTSAELCPGMFTAEGYACVRCTGDVSCLDQANQIYCLAEACLTDSRCTVRASRPLRAGPPR
jgi:hypothetical protein